jgi:APA family basic amino acid/polyamine antiporter
MSKNLWLGSLLAIGGMVGSAIFSLSGVTIANAGSGAIFSWLLAGIIMIGFGLVTASLAGQYPESGGMFFYPEKVFKSPGLGGVSALFYWFGCMAGVTFSVYSIGQYLSFVVPLPAWALTLANVLALALAYLVVLTNFSKMSAINGVLTVALIAGIIIVCAFLRIHTGVGINLGLTSNWINFPSSITQIPTAILAYGAIVAPAFLSSKIGASQVTKILLIAGSATVVIYLFLVTTVTAIVPNKIWSQEPGLVYAPLSAAIGSGNGLAWLSVIVSILAILALFTSVIVLLRLASQALQSAASSQVFPQVLSSKRVALSVCAFLSLVSVVFWTDIGTVIQSGALLTVAFDAIICAAAFKVGELRVKILACAVFVALLACYVPSISSGNWLIWAVFAGFLLISLLVVVGSQHYYAQRRET